MTGDSLVTYLDLLFGAEPAGSFLEVRWRLGDRRGMGQLWRPVERRWTALDSIRAIGARTDLYVACAPRTRRHGGREAIERVHALWVDCDSSEAIAALEHFQPAPSMVVCSGSGRHVYWSIFPPAPPAEVERANRRLANALGADPAATDAARILRPPGTFNFKSGEPVAVEIVDQAGSIYSLEQVASP